MQSDVTFTVADVILSTASNYGGARTKPLVRFIPPTSASASLSRKEKYSGKVVTGSLSLQTIHEGYIDNAVSSIFTWSHQPAASIQSDAALEAQALVSVLNDIGDRKINLAQAWGERQQTVNLLTNTLRRIADGVSALRRGNVAGALRALGSPSRAAHLSTRDIADQWLEIQYGWKPLLQDVYGACDTLRERDKDLSRYTLSAKATKKDNGVGVQLSNIGLYDRHVKTDHTNGVFVRLDYKVSHTFATSMQQVGVTDPATLAWELLPWSFVVDWFIPIGNWLSAVNATTGLTFQGGSRTIRKEKNSISRVVMHPGVNAPGNSCYVTASGFDKTVSRLAYGASPSPSFPRFKNPVSLTHFWNAVALARGRFRR